MTAQDIDSRRRTHVFPRRIALALALAANLHVASATDAQVQPAASSGLLPSGLLAVAPSRPGSRHVLVAEKSSQTLFVYEFRDSRGSLMRTLPCTTGKVKGDKEREGDLRTPEGVYWFTRRIPGSELPPLYGAGALVMDYPNHFDLLDGKTGSGIWMHGVETNERAYVENDTRGCIALRNDHFAALRRLIRLDDTPILVVERLELRPRDEIAAEAAAISDFVERWRSAWESSDIETYLSLHGAEFRAGKLDRRAWARHKRDLARLEGDRRITVRDMTILREKDRAWITFRQEYSSSTHQDVGLKQLFVRGSGDTWRIVGERWRSLDESFPGAAPDASMAVAVIAGAQPVLSPPVTTEAAGNEPVAAAALEPPPVVAASALQPAPAESAPRPADEGAMPPAPTSPIIAAPSELPAAPQPAQLAKRRPPEAELVRPRVARGAFRLIAPHAHETEDLVVVVAQLLNTTPTITRSGTIVVSLTTATSRSRQVSRERFTVRQGRDVQAGMPLADLPAVLTVLVLDDGGRVLLDQDVQVIGGEGP